MLQIVGLDAAVVRNDLLRHDSAWLTGVLASQLLPDVLPAIFCLLDLCCSGSNATQLEGT